MEALVNWRIWRTLNGYPVVSRDYIPLPLAALRVYSAYYRVRFGHELNDPFAWPLVEFDIPSPSDVFSDNGRVKNASLMSEHRARVLMALDGEKGKGLLDWPDVVQWMKAHQRRKMSLKFGAHIKDQRAELLKWLHEALADGALYAVAQMEATGELKGLKPQAWSCRHEVALSRFKSCRFNWHDPFEAKPRSYANGRNSFGFLFIPREHVETAVSVLEGGHEPRQHETGTPPEPAAIDEAPIRHQIPGAPRRGRPKPKWYPLLQRQLRMYRTRCQRAMELNNEMPQPPTNQQLADAISKDAGGQRVTSAAVQRHRAAADKSLDCL